MSTRKDREVDAVAGGNGRPPGSPDELRETGSPAPGRAPGAVEAAPEALPRVAGPRTMVGGALPRWALWLVYGAATVAALVAILVADVSIALATVAAVAVAGVAVYVWSRAAEGPRRAKDRTVTLVVTSAFAMAVIPLVSVVYTVIDRGMERFDVPFFTESARNVVGEGGGAYHAIVGTVVITAVATLASVPIGIMAAIYLTEYGRGKLKAALVFFVDVMTGIPSIVAGLFAFALFTLIFGPAVRLGVMGAVALSVLMVPIVVRSTEEMLKVVPNSLREASYALGVSKWRTIVKVVLPTAMAGIVTGVMVAVARVIGETAPLLITVGTFTSVNWNPFEGRMAALPVFSYNQYKSPGVPPDAYFARAWAAALALILIVMVLNLIARILYSRFGKGVH